MKKMFAVFAVLVAAAVVLVACSSGGGGTSGGGGGPVGVAPAASTTTNAAATASSTSSIAANSGVTLSQLAAGGSLTGGAPRFRSPLAKKDARFSKAHAVQSNVMKTVAAKKTAALKKAKQLAATKHAPVSIPTSSSPCTDGGSVTMSGTYDDQTFDYSLTMTYATCREFDQEMNGTIVSTGTFTATATATSETFTLTLGDGVAGVTTADFMARLFSPGYTDIFATYLADMTLAGSGACSDAACTTYTSSMTANGVEDYNDFTDTYTLTYTALTISGSDTQSATSANFSGNYSISGGFSEAWTGTAAGNVTITYGVPGTPVALAWAGTDTYYEESMDGQVVTNFTPDNCSEGTFVIDTTTPVRYDYATGKTVAGRMVINTTTIIVFNSNGTVTVTDTSGTTTYTSIIDIENLCPFQDFEDNSTSTNATGGQTYTTTGNTLLATLTWTASSCPAGGCTSDMDLHLDYYASAAPTATDFPSWHIYFGNQDPIDVLPNDDPNTFMIYDSIGDVIGGNEGNLDYDDTNYAGPEHLTVDPMAAGYYILYVDPFSMDSDPDATVTVTLKIGSNSYSFPTHTFGPLDYVIHRVCDIKVAADGTVTILPPNTQLYTSYAPAMRALKVKK